MLMTTGTIQDRVQIKDGFSFTEQPAVVDPARNRKGWTRKHLQT